MVFQGEFGLYFLGGGFYVMFPAKSARFQKTNKKDIYHMPESTKQNPSRDFKKTYYLDDL